MSWFGRLQTQRFSHRSSKAGVSNDNGSCLQIRVIPHMQKCLSTIWIWGCSTPEINLYAISFGQEWEKLILMTHTTGSPAINQIFEWRLILRSQTIGNFLMKSMDYHQFLWYLWTSFAIPENYNWAPGKLCFSNSDDNMCYHRCWKSFFVGWSDL
jgi:hypothetical protein